MKTLKIVTLTTFTIASLGGGYGLSKVIFPNYVGEDKVLWETVRVHNNGTKRCQLLRKPEKEEDIPNLLEQVSKKPEEVIQDICITSWSNGLVGKDIGNNIQESLQVLEFWIRGRTQEIINKLLIGENYQGIQVLEDLGNQKESGVPDSSSESSNYTIEDLKKVCDVDGTSQTNWVIVKCPSVTKRN
ncbi:hypothetical protein [Mycoplasma suis]|uniref:Uncharacterized protein n=1 Tax=Mycoplasma suis (strain Illinois) TaxID=768700 RepID=F0QRT7_MYCSL|nr:hypothetical protein [Mycoplasma suis]ADX98207.1 hypothetical protein MSU_0676 [Mycoplasma suis str. Illinois]